MVDIELGDEGLSDALETELAAETETVESEFAVEADASDNVELEIVEPEAVEGVEPELAAETVESDMVDIELGDEDLSDALETELAAEPETEAVESEFAAEADASDNVELEIVEPEAVEGVEPELAAEAVESDMVDIELGDEELSDALETELAAEPEVVSVETVDESQSVPVEAGADDSDLVVGVGESTGIEPGLVADAENDALEIEDIDSLDLDDLSALGGIGDTGSKTGSESIDLLDEPSLDDLEALDFEEQVGNELELSSVASNDAIPSTSSAVELDPFDEFDELDALSSVVDGEPADDVESLVSNSQKEDDDVDLDAMFSDSVSRVKQDNKGTLDLMSTVEEIEQTVQGGVPAGSQQLDGVSKHLNAERSSHPSTETGREPLLSEEVIHDSDGDLEKILADNDAENRPSETIDYESLVSVSTGEVESTITPVSDVRTTSEMAPREAAFITDSVESLLERSIRESTHHSLRTNFSAASEHLDRGFFESIKSEMDPWANFSDAKPAEPLAERISVLLSLPESVPAEAVVVEQMMLEAMGLPDPPYHPIRMSAQTVVSRWGEVYVETSDCGPTQSKFRVRVIPEHGETWFKDFVYTDLLEASGKPLNLSALAERFEQLHENTRRTVLRKGVDGLDGFQRIQTRGDD
jgi:hypothetical protein